ncbi:MAG: hypothetical protein KF716_25335 [Anaerolineae bacterium]|nr:hypothetical protein [Anaerolineae bacterium]
MRRDTGTAAAAKRDVLMASSIASGRSRGQLAVGTAQAVRHCIGRLRSGKRSEINPHSSVGWDRHHTSVMRSGTEI